MRAALFNGARSIDMADFPLPEEAVPGAAVVRVDLCGICGSDVAAFRAGSPYPPAITGHEWTGTVLSVGEGVDHLEVGSRVVAGVPLPCGRCVHCAAGLTQRCVELTAIPFGLEPLSPPHGAYAERIQFPASSLIPVPDALPKEQAALVEPATVALHAVRRLSPQIGETAVVLGAGPVGLFALQLLRLAGASKVVVVEPREYRRRLALDLGATVAVDPGQPALDAVASASDGLGAAVVYDCVGNEASLNSAVELSRVGAGIMLVGVSSTPITVNPLGWMVREITLHTTLAHLNHEFGVTVDLMLSGQLRTDGIADVVVGLDGLGDALSALADGGDHVKVLVDPHR